MASVSGGILSLPEELLVQVFVEAAIDNPSTLLDIGLTCQAFHAIALDDDAVWREIHNIKYDDPRAACAFVTPRTQYAWKERVLDRLVVAEFMDQLFSSDLLTRDPVDHSTPLMNATPRALATIQDLINDLPALGEPSKNAPLIESLILSHIFSIMLVRRIPDGTNAGDHIQAVVAHWPALEEIDSIAIRVRSKPYISYHDGKDQPYGPWGKTTDWHGVACAAMVAKMILDSRAAGVDEDARVKHAINQVFECGLDSVRGPGLLGLKRLGDRGDGSVWDWAQVEGEWCAKHSNSVTNPMGMYTEEPEQYTLMLADKAYIDTERAKRASDVLWVSWSDFEGLDLNNDSGLPPLYFCGSPTKGKAGFIFGVVHLTSDHPPQLQWDVAFATRERRKLFRAVQLGGPGSKRGAIGTWYEGHSFRTGNGDNWYDGPSGTSCFFKIA